MQLRIPLLVATYLLTLLFSGVIFAWTDMQLVMEREGIYCKTAPVCTGDSAKFNEVQYNLIVTIGEVRH